MGWLSMIAELGLNIAPFTQALAKAKGEAKQFGTELARQLGPEKANVLLGLTEKLGAAFGGYISAKMVKSTLDYATETKALANRLETTTENAQVLKFAMGDAAEGLAGAFKKIRIAQADSGLVESFQALGISLEQMRSSSAEEIFMKISQRVSEGALSAHEFSAAIKIMGKNADELFPKMKILAEQSGLYKKLGLGLDDEAIQRLATVNKGLKLIPAALKQIKDAGVNLFARTFEGFGKLFAAGALSAEGLMRGGDHGQELRAGGWEMAKRGLNRLPIPFLKLQTNEDDEKLNAMLQKRLDERKAARRDADEAKAAERMKQETAELKERTTIEERLKAIRFNALSDTEKRLYLEKQLKEQQAEAAEATKGSLDAKKAELAVAETQEKLKGFENKTQRLHADSLAAVGTFVGNASRGNAAVDIQRAQLEVQKKIADNTDPTKKPTAQF